MKRSTEISESFVLQLSIERNNLLKILQEIEIPDIEYNLKGNILKDWIISLVQQSNSLANSLKDDCLEQMIHMDNNLYQLEQEVNNLHFENQQLQIKLEEAQNTRGEFDQDSNSPVFELDKRSQRTMNQVLDQDFDDFQPQRVKMQRSKTILGGFNINEYKPQQPLIDKNHIFEEKIEKLKNKNTTLIKEMAVLEHQRKDDTQYLEKLERELSQLKQQLDVLTKEKDYLLSQYSEKTEELEQISKVKSKIEDQYLEVMGNHSKSQKEHKQTKEKLSQIQEYVTKLTKDRNSKNQIIDQKTKKITELEVIIKNFANIQDHLNNSSKIRKEDLTIEKLQDIIKEMQKTKTQEDTPARPKTIEGLLSPNGKNVKITIKDDETREVIISERVKLIRNELADLEQEEDNQFNQYRPQIKSNSQSALHDSYSNDRARLSEKQQPFEYLNNDIHHHTFSRNGSLKQKDQQPLFGQDKQHNKSVGGLSINISRSGSIKENSIKNNKGFQRQQTYQAQLNRFSQQSSISQRSFIEYQEVASNDQDFYNPPILDESLLQGSSPQARFRGSSVNTPIWKTFDIEEMKKQSDSDNQSQESVDPHQLNNQSSQLVESNNNKRISAVSFKTKNQNQGTQTDFITQKDMNLQTDFTFKDYEEQKYESMMDFSQNSSVLQLDRLLDDNDLFDKMSPRFSSKRSTFKDIPQDQSSAYGILQRKQTLDKLPKRDRRKNKSELPPGITGITSQQNQQQQQQHQQQEICNPNCIIF